MEDYLNYYNKDSLKRFNFDGTVNEIQYTIPITLKHVIKKDAEGKIVYLKDYFQKEINKFIE